MYDNPGHAACVDIVMRQNKYPNSSVEQDHRAIQRIIRPGGQTMSTGKPFYRLAACSPEQPNNFFRPDSTLATEPQLAQLYRL